mmetsp:Transcript_35649/g.89058  ORF Transcript_35649/g.89058 Transcript_35649/m.89058 type:complete len:93 (+) Transcript_35649:1089-1367(+)
MHTHTRTHTRKQIKHEYSEKDTRHDRMNDAAQSSPTIPPLAAVRQRDNEPESDDGQTDTTSNCKYNGRAFTCKRLFGTWLPKATKGLSEEGV